MKRSVSKLRVDRQLIRPLTDPGLAKAIAGQENRTITNCHGCQLVPDPIAD